STLKSKARKSSTTDRQWKKLLDEIIPSQGRWSEEQYLAMTDYTHRRVEFTDGFLEVLPTPTDRHQTLLQFMFLALLNYIEPRGGKVHFSGLRLQIRADKY